MTVATRADSVVVEGERELTQGIAWVYHGGQETCFGTNPCSSHAWFGCSPDRRGSSKRSPGIDDGEKMGGRPESGRPRCGGMLRSTNESRPRLGPSIDRINKGFASLLMKSETAFFRPLLIEFPSGTAQSHPGGLSRASTPRDSREGSALGRSRNLSRRDGDLHGLPAVRTGELRRVLFPGDHTTSPRHGAGIGLPDKGLRFGAGGTVVPTPPGGARPQDGLPDARGSWTLADLPATF